MKKNIPLVLTVLLLAACTTCRADLTDKWFWLGDTVVVVNNIPYRVRHVPQQEFDSLHAIYRVVPEAPLKDPAEINAALGPEYHLDYHYTSYDDGNDEMGNYGIFLKEFRRHKKFRLIIPENDGLIGYFPRERILMYAGGHSSDQAFFVDNGEGAYNPEESATSPDGRFRLTGMYSGQDHVDYTFEEKDRKTGRYKHLCSFSDVVKEMTGDFFYSHYLGYIYELYWAGHTLYFRTGGGPEYDDNYSSWYRYYAITPYSKLPPSPAWEKGIYLPDPVFRNYCLTRFDTNGDGAISEQEAEAVAEINIDGQALTYPVHNVCGIESFKNLVRFHCAHNQIRSIDLIGFDKLQFLDCSHNRLSELWLGCDSLLELDCSHNKLRYCEQSCPALKNLNCSYNQLERLNVESYKQLEYVDCTVNPEMKQIYTVKTQNFNLKADENVEIEILQ